MLLTTLALASCGAAEGTGEFVTYDEFFASFSTEYEPATSLAKLAARSEVASRATLVDVEDGRFVETNGRRDVITLNLVFESADLQRYYVQLTRPEGSSIDALRSALPLQSESVIYLIPNTDPLKDGWQNVRGDGNEWFFTTPQGWILDHPDRGIVFPLEDNEQEVPFGEPPVGPLSLDLFEAG